MPYSNTKAIIEQIYNFVLEKHGLASKSRFMQLSIFFRELHEGDDSKFTADRSFYYKGIFNNKEKSIFANAAPDFFDKHKFLDWVVKSID